MDTGNGLMDRFLIMVPSSIRRLPYAQIETKSHLDTHDIVGVHKVCEPLVDLDPNNPTLLYFSEEALHFLYFNFICFEQMESDFISDFNNALREGRPTPKSKKSDLVPRIAASIHTLHQVFYSIVNKRPFALTEEITKEILIKTIHFVEIAEEQKEFFSMVSIIIIIQKYLSLKYRNITTNS
ncbi:uncharacterized protein LOC130630001 [Hydractinia symbiolongicarpus]|uniref:uncharacterized protein LOC130630001 n=1 Tax=Hydractinia symbiolongicarpus TaxID=13093 RepID=UPI00254DEF45|nr:uncharacterized protein LOC130630001 [Hydractinia symbiolongicarpus]